MGEEKRCVVCGALLLVVIQSWFVELLRALKIPAIEIKCRKCKTLNKI